MMSFVTRPTSPQPTDQRLARIAEVVREMRLPLSGLVGYLQGLEDNVFPANAETYARIQQQITRLNGLLEELAALAPPPPPPESPRTAVLAQTPKR